MSDTTVMAGLQLVDATSMDVRFRKLSVCVCAVRVSTRVVMHLFVHGFVMRQCTALL